MAHLARILCLALALCMPGLAWAHTQFNGSEPAPNALVAERPETVTLWFSEPVSPVAMRWIAPGGDIFPAMAEPGGNQVLVAPPPEAGDGSYLLAWRVVSIDGHPVSGNLVLSVGAVSDIPTLSSIVWPPVSTWAVIVTKFLLSFALVLGVGGTVYRCFVAAEARPPDAATLWSLYLAFPAALLFVGAQGLDLLGLRLPGIFSADPWVTGAGTSILRTSVLAALSALAALIVLRVRQVSRHRPARLALASAAWAFAASSYAVSGHTATAEPEWQAVSAMFVHGIAMIYWLGALLPLFRLIRRGDPFLAELRRFSTIAIPLVALLIVSGILLTSIHAGAGGFRAMAMSGYGILLFIKLVSVIGLLLVAIHNRLVLTPAMNRGTAGANGALRRAILVEIVLALMIVAFASSFRLTPPPATMSQKARTRVVAFTQSDIAAELELTPGATGPNEIKVSVSDANGAPLEPIELKLGFSIPGNELEPIEVVASLTEGAVWQTGPIILPQAGTWDVMIDLLVTDFGIVTLSTEVEIAP